MDVALHTYHTGWRTEEEKIILFHGAGVSKEIPKSSLIQIILSTASNGILCLSESEAEKPHNNALSVISLGTLGPAICDAIASTHSFWSDTTRSEK